MLSHGNIHISQIRVEQLRHLAHHHGLTPTSIIDRAIRNEWSAAGLGPSLPPFEIFGDVDLENDKAPMVSLITDGITPVLMTPAQASAVADGLRKLISREHTHFVVPAHYCEFKAGFVGERRGRGYILRIADNTSRDFKALSIPLSSTVAEDLAAAFDAAADQALAVAPAAAQ
ncbi:hypothetical protein NS228_12850 [Methylobacterium indicum]|uniref:hypothetical protein n=1 Tax=Methylobacterium indicum TaxID=1775910 RepID=UPI000734573E|nr:hypothetical protein [Methylobacterium indicum]KTS30478.1 hypothetical protein NS229_16250 [Methylobacterium indicum]KTS40028.1 hypothetical protein NS228_12850 [Methylobacterium indicum]KTS53636.1 hypothetical protein NS230_04980 [Methylobacterium indicum]